MLDQLKQAWERLRSVKGFTTWLWIVILFVVLSVGLLLSEPVPAVPGETPSSPFGSTGLALSVFFRWMAVIGLVYVAFIFYRKWQSGKTGTTQRRITVVERFHLSPKQSLLLIKTDDREFLVGATDASIQLIAELETSGMEPATPQISSNEFESLLSKRKGDSLENHDRQE
ncbi:FliO/MopB family protein [Leptolinea tardivitalis]|uniref:Flagellar protein n=1 Tax=Leptolinea tardivitalis TaxID=229920 RepID=A0A0P6X9G8_9CHLR|nr:flagellar biosynthetic protein FliO [Leptolinea tardivitalis]KPL71068.1 hypothetical protein ADM99_12370 [Leptolinea tardivitalis]GAP22485.1 flagellar biogenesis protein [Leptolinea tardivitalis]